MVNYCPNCGAKLEKEYNFCPACGKDLRNTVEEKTGPVIICPNCGEENPSSNFECSACGAALKKGKKDRRKEIPLQKRQQAPPARGNAQKGLDFTKLIAIFAGVIGIVIIVLIVSGTFEDKAPGQQTTNQSPTSGVDLASIQRINDLEKQVQADPGNYELLLQLAHLKNDSGFYEKAIADYTRYLEKFPADADVRVDMGVCYYNLKQYDAAIREMKKALEYKPDHQIGHLNLGIVNLAAGRVDESKKWLQKAEAIDPNSEIGLRAKELLKNH